MQSFITRLLLLAFGLSFSPVGGKSQIRQDTLSLEDLIELAQQRSFAKEEAQWLRQQSELNYHIFQTSLKPQLTAFANFPNFLRTSQEIVQPDGTISFQSISYNNSSLGLEINQALPGTGGRLFVQTDLQRFDDFNTDKTSYNGVPVRVGISQPLFGFNPWKWDKQLELLRFREANHKYQSDRETINMETANLFFQLLSASTNLQIAKANKTSNRALFEIAQERYELGNISYSDLMRLRLELISATKDERRAEQSMRLVSNDLYTYLGFEYGQEVIVPKVPEVTDSLIITQATALQQALANRFENLTFQRLLIETNRNIAEVKGRGGFQADLNASFGWTRSGAKIGDIFMSPQAEQLVQVQLSIPILDWGQQKSRVTLAKAQQSYWQKRVKQEKNEFLTRLNQALSEFQNLQEQLGLTRSLQAIAAERFEISKESYVLGAISLTDLTLAQREKDQTVREYIETLSLYWQNYYLLRTLTLFDFKEQQAISY